MSYAILLQTLPLIALLIILGVARTAATPEQDAKIVSLINDLENPNPNYEERTAFLYDLIAACENYKGSIPILTDALTRAYHDFEKDSIPFGRISELASALEKFGSDAQGAVPIVCEMLKDSVHEDLSHRAAMGLATIGKGSPLEPVTHIA